MGPYNKVHTDFIEIYFDFCFVLFFVFLEIMTDTYQLHPRNS